MKIEDYEIMKHGLSVYEIAEILECSPQNISAIIRKTIKKLKPVAEANNLKEFLET
jgi:transcriptional regulator